MKSNGKSTFTIDNKSGLGRKTGSRNKALVAREQIGDDNLNSLLAIQIEEALNKNLDTGKYLLDKVYGNAKEEKYISLEIPDIEGNLDIGKVQDFIIKSVATGQISLDSAERFNKIIDDRRKTFETVDMVALMQSIDERMKNAGIL